MMPTEMKRPPEKAEERASSFWEELKEVDLRGMVPEMTIMRNMMTMVSILMSARSQSSD